MVFFVHQYFSGKFQAYYWGVIFLGEVVPYHPSLNEALNQPEGLNIYEWLTLKIKGFSFACFSDADNEKGDVTTTGFNLYSYECYSEYGTINLNKAVIGISPYKKSQLESLEGKHPLGSINYYDPERASIIIKIPEEAYTNLLLFLANDYQGLSVKIAIPTWNDIEAKCLPIIKYALVYEYEKQI